MDEINLQTPFGSIYGRSAGEERAPLVLAVHGFSQRNGWHSWEPLMDPLAGAGYRVVSLDMPGWGQSTATSFDPLNPEQGVDVIEAVLDGLGYAQAKALMGKSWGGGLALTMALTRPHRMEKLILTAPAFMNFDLLAGLSQPVLLAWADDDKAIPVSAAEWYRANVPDIQVVIYETGGHSAATNNAGDFAPRAVTFLNKPTVELQS